MYASTAYYCQGAHDQNDVSVSTAGLMGLIENRIGIYRETKSAAAMEKMMHKLDAQDPTDSANTTSSKNLQHEPSSRSTTNGGRLVRGRPTMSMRKHKENLDSAGRFKVVQIPIELFCESMRHALDDDTFMETAFLKNDQDEAICRIDAFIVAIEKIMPSNSSVTVFLEAQVNEASDVMAQHIIQSYFTTMTVFKGTKELNVLIEDLMPLILAFSDCTNGAERYRIRQASKTTSEQNERRNTVVEMLKQQFALQDLNNDLPLAPKHAPYIPEMKYPRTFRQIVEATDAWDQAICEELDEFRFLMDSYLQCSSGLDDLFLQEHHEAVREITAQYLENSSRDAVSERMKTLVREQPSINVSRRAMNSYFMDFYDAELNNEGRKNYPADGFQDHLGLFYIRILPFVMAFDEHKRKSPSYSLKDHENVTRLKKVAAQAAEVVLGFQSPGATRSYMIDRVFVVSNGKELTFAHDFSESFFTTLTEVGKAFFAYEALYGWPIIQKIGWELAYDYFMQPAGSCSSMFHKNLDGMSLVRIGSLISPRSK